MDYHFQLVSVKKKRILLLDQIVQLQPELLAQLLQGQHHHHHHHRLVCGRKFMGR